MVSKKNNNITNPIERKLQIIKIATKQKFSYSTMNESCVHNNKIENRKRLKTSNQNGKKMMFSKNTHPPVKQLTRHSHIHVHFVSRIVLRTWRYHRSST
jgi:hypothetical protein